MTFQEAIKFLKKTSPLKITVSGDIGAGKSTFAKRLALELDIPRIYIGQFMREEAAKRGMTLEEFGKLQETDDSIDRMMDKMQEEKSREIKRGVFEGRTAWHFVHEPTAKLFLAVDLDKAAQRIWDDTSKMRQKYDSTEDLKHGITRRKQSETLRYSKYYGIDAYDHINFDIIIDTDELNLNEVFETTVIDIAKFLSR